MCIKILTAEDERKYDITKSLEEQLVGYKQIVVDYEPNDPSLDKFLDEVERFCQKGITRPLNIKVKSNDNLGGIKIKSRIADYNKGASVNELIASLALSYAAADKKLEEISAICLNGRMNAKT